jgi:hypothetical protein
MLLEQRYHANTSFLTLTYDDEHLPLKVADDGTPIPTLDKDHFKQFIKDIRNNIGKVRYFGVGEYGMEGDRPHYHAIFYTDWQYYSDVPRLQEIWGRGFIQYVPADETRMAYCAKYTTKGLTGTWGNESGRVPEFSLKSNRPGVGARGLEALGDAYRTRNGAEAIVATGDIGTNYRLGGRHYPIPEYYRVKLREALGVPKYACDRMAGALRDKIPPIIDIDEVEKAKNKAKRKLNVAQKHTKEELKAKIEKFNNKVRRNDSIADLIQRQPAQEVI